MRQAQTRNDFSVGSIPRTIMRLALPMIGAQVINALYNIVDRAYIGRIPGAGAMALTGVGLAFPIIMVITAFTNLCGAGGGPLCSIARGEGRNDYAERIMGTAFAALLAMSVILGAVGFALREPLLWMFGASENTIGYAGDYLGVYLCGTPAAMLSLGMNPFINSQGFARTGMFTVLIGAVLNIILDPLFIFTLDMGVRGAALATVISQLFSAVWALRFLFGPRTILRIRRRYVRLDFPILRRIWGLGISNFTMAFSDSLVQIACNTTLLAFGGDIYIGVMTVLSSVRQLVMMALRGLSNGAQPVIGYNFGAGRPDRVKRSVGFMILICLCYATVCWIVVQLFPGAIIRIFNSDPQMIALGIPIIRTYFLTFILMGFQMAGQSSFVALGRSRQAVFFSMLRKVFLVLPLALILPRVTGLGVMGVFVAEPISDMISPVACIVAFYFTVWRRLDVLVEQKNSKDADAGRAETASIKRTQMAMTKFFARVAFATRFFRF